MGILEFVERLDRAFTDASLNSKHEEPIPSQETEVVIKSANGAMFKVNNIVWCEEAAEFQIWVAPL